MRNSALLTLGMYYAATGAWPLLSMRSFEAVTGPKVDRWLVRMVAALALANGVALVVGSRRRKPSAEAIALALGSAIAFTAIDVTYVARGRIAPIYLGDAAVEIPLAGAVIWQWLNA